MKFNTTVLIVIVFLVLSWFYWFQYRPSKIRSSCVVLSREKAIEQMKIQAQMTSVVDIKEAAKRNLFNTKIYDDYYSRCLNEYGIIK